MPKEQNIENIIEDFTIKRDYESIIEYLTNYEKKHELNEKYKLILFLANEIIDVEKTGEIPKSNLNKSNDISDNIYCKNYKKAMFLIKNKYLKFEKEFFDFRNNTIFILLDDLLEFIDLKKTFDKFFKETDTNNEYENDINNILKFLRIQNIEDATNCLKKYLKEINRTEYESVFLVYIKLSFLEKDYEFRKLNMHLINIQKEDYQLDITGNMYRSIDSLVEGRISESEANFDIVKKGNDLAIAPANIELLTTKLNDLIEKGKKVEEDKYYNENKMFNFDKTNNEGYLSEEEIQLNQDKEYLFSMYDKLSDDGIIVLESMDKERIERLASIIKYIRDYYCTVITDGEEQKLTLLYSSFKQYRINLYKISIEAKESYRKKEYSKCIEKLREILEIKVLRGDTVGLMGLSYSKLQRFSLAIDYLTLSNHLAKIENTGYDYTKMINVFKKLDDRDPKNENFDTFYGVDEIKTIAQMILSGKNIDIVCKELNIDDEKKAKACLLLARAYYSEDNDTIGDKFLKKAEITKNKSASLKRLINETREGKKFFKNRPLENNILRILKLK